MSLAHRHAAERHNMDPEVSAIRDLISKEENSPANSTAVVQEPIGAAVETLAQGLPPIPPATLDAGGKEGQASLGQRVGDGFGGLKGRAGQAIRSYRPNRNNIIATSLVLLMILQPMWVLIPVLVAITSIGLCYARMGSDRFWRALIGVFKRWECRFPDSARVFKHRAVIWADKWDRFLLVLPEGCAERFGSSDLKAVGAADRQHDAAMAARLSRLRDDATG